MRFPTMLPDEPPEGAPVSFPIHSSVDADPVEFDASAEPTQPLLVNPAPLAPDATYPEYYFGTMPPLPPFGDPPHVGGQPRRPRHRRTALALLALVVMLALGMGIGAGIVTHVNGSAQASSSTIAVASNSQSSTSNAAAATGSANLQVSLESVVQKDEPSVVEVTSTNGGGGQESIGSGDILTTSGYIVTNDHVVQGYSTFTVTLANGTNTNAQLIGQSAANDLAVLKISASNLKPITLANSSQVQVGAFTIAVGNPLGLAQTATFGIVSALNRTASEAPNGPAGQLTGLIQTSAPLNPGNSGGALVNLQGQLIGIPTLGATNTETGTAADGIGYAIPSNVVGRVATQLINSAGATNAGQNALSI